MREANEQHCSICRGQEDKLNKTKDQGFEVPQVYFDVSTCAAAAVVWKKTQDYPLVMSNFLIKQTICMDIQYSPK